MRRKKYAKHATNLSQRILTSLYVPEHSRTSPRITRRSLASDCPVIQAPVRKTGYRAVATRLLSDRSVRMYRWFVWPPPTKAGKHTRAGSFGYSLNPCDRV